MTAEPDLLRAWKATIRPRTRVPDWQEFGPPASDAVRIALASDQGQICCYCMGTIANGAFHIEHFRPRSAFERQTYRWKNLLASCEGYRHPNVNGVVVDSQRQCGAAKENWFRSGVTIDPQATGVESHFRYRLDGKIAAAKSLPKARKNAVNESIDHLNLNAPALVERRKQLLAQAAESFVKMSRADWRAKYLAVGGEGRLQEFWAALNYNFTKHWDVRFPNV
ncbi:MAG: hypothetical protein RL367_177 [Pseudomonadota bacterium]|jgi:uncharacterized protein (TIGR02646 family)